MKFLITGRGIDFKNTILLNQELLHIDETTESTGELIVVHPRNVC